VLEDGVAPYTVTWTREQGRNFYSSAGLILTASWGDPAEAGKVALQVRSKASSPASGNYWTAPGVAWPWAVGSCRIWPTSIIADLGEFTGAVALYDIDGAADLAVSEPIDLEAIESTDMEVRPFIELENPPYYSSDLPSLLIEVGVSSFGTGSFTQSATAIVAEPQLHYADEASPPAAMPVGRWNPTPFIHGALYVRTQNQSVPDTDWRPLGFPAASTDRYLDTHQFVTDAASTSFLIPFEAVWDTMMGCEFDIDSTGDRQLRIVHHRGTSSRVVASKRARATSAGEWKDTLTRPVWAKRGDRIAFEVWQSSGGYLPALGSADADQTWAGVALRGFQNRVYDPGGGGWSLADWS
jgi:hypothetical protein